MLNSLFDGIIRFNIDAYFTSFNEPIVISTERFNGLVLSVIQCFSELLVVPISRCNVTIPVIVKVCTKV